MRASLPSAWIGTTEGVASSEASSSEAGSLAVESAIDRPGGMAEDLFDLCEELTEAIEDR